MARPREFDQEKVTAQIMNLFWEKGFEGTSMEDLVAATGLNKGSLYSCLGNKQKVFEIALDHYLNRGPFSVRKQAGAIDALVDFFTRAVSEADLPAKQRRGCFIFNSCLEFGNKSAQLTPLVMSLCRMRQIFFKNLVEEAQKSGEISNDINSAKAGQKIFAAAFTIREMSKFMPDKEFLSDIANSALAELGTKKRVTTV